MGVFTIGYETEIKPKLDEAITDALSREVADAALLAITQSAKERVYDAYSDPKFLSRRESLLNATRDETYSVEAHDNELTITAHPSLQNLFGGDNSGDLGDIIAEGWSNYHMPFPRPWMDEGISESIGNIESALKAGLERNGF